MTPGPLNGPHGLTGALGAAERPGGSALATCALTSERSLVRLSPRPLSARLHERELQFRSGRMRRAGKQEETDAPDTIRT
jgi:hypothetical protein